MEHFLIQVFLLRAALAFFYQSENPTNGTGLLLVGGAKTGISQLVEFWTPVHAGSRNNSLEESAAHLKETSLKESSLKETALKDSSAHKKESSMHCPTTARGMWGHTTDYLPNGRGGEKWKTAKKCRTILESTAVSIFVDIVDSGWIDKCKYSICQYNQYIYKYWDGSAV